MSSSQSMRSPGRNTPANLRSPSVRVGASSPASRTSAPALNRSQTSGGGRGYIRQSRPKSVDFGKFPYRVEVVNSKVTRDEESKSVAWYSIRVTSLEVPSLRWEVDHRYSQFKQLHQQFLKMPLKLPKILPPLPGTKLLRSLDATYLKKKCGELDQYLRTIACNEEINQSEEFINFIFDSHSLEAVCDALKRKPLYTIYIYIYIYICKP